MAGIIERGTMVRGAVKKTPDQITAENYWQGHKQRAFQAQQFEQEHQKGVAAAKGLTGQDALNAYYQARGRDPKTVMPNYRYPPKK